MSGIDIFGFILTTGIIIPIILSVPPDFENPLPDNFTESHPTLELKHYEFYVLNRTYETESKENRTKLKIPKVFTHLIYECNSTLPTRWHFAGRARDAQVKNLYVNKYRLYKEKYQFRSTLYIEFRDPESVQNVTCQNECLEELNDTANCQFLSMTALIDDSQFLDDAHKFRVPFIYMSFANGNGSGEEKNSHKLGYNPDCTFSLDVDLNEGKYKCSKRINDTKVEISTIFLPCRNLDECDIFYQKENKPNCTNTTILFNESCDEEGCYQLKPLTSPFILSCGEDNSFSLARNFFPVTFNLLNSSNSMDQNFKIEEFPDKKSDFSERFSHIQVLTVTINTMKAIYVGESRTFQCTGLKSFFTYGIQWFLVYSEDNETNLGLGYENMDLNDVNSNSYTIVSTLNVTFNTSTVTDVKCRAFWWNSFKWAEDNFSVTIIDVEGPSLNLSLSPICESNCSCDTVERRTHFCCPKHGLPPPEIKWIIDEVVIDQNKGVQQSWYKISENNTHSILQLTEKDDVQGRYNTFKKIQCISGNKKGTACHIFNINEGFSTVMIMAIAIGSIVFLSTVLLLLSLCKIKRQRRKLQQLPDEEVDEFVKGNPKGTDAFLLPYNQDLEIPPEDLIISNQTLGSGAFAQVIKGQVGFTTVAVKMIKKSADVVYMRALLSELKIMSYVGQHPNLVNLVGSCTRNIRKRELSIVLEFCERGDMLGLIRNGRKVFVDKFEAPAPSLPSFSKKSMKANDRCSTIVYQNSSVQKLSTINLMKWAHEIASGMEFLSSKNVVHGDLAARNVLITHDLKAKVSDFGLSKQLFEYSIYVQKINMPLPLRWMAYESLKDLEFSVQSDIWSYGVVLWELFSLGEAPFPGMEWGFGAWKLIANGLRMDKPNYASDEIYQIMMQCWELKPSSRPSFTALKEATEILLRDARELL